jgi:hypothetical protein
LNTSEHQDREVYTDPMEQLVMILSELPTDRAMMEIGKRSNTPDAIRKVVETMAFHKEDLLNAIVLIVKRDVAMMKFMKAHYNLEELGASEIDFSKITINLNVDQKN